MYKCSNKNLSFIVVLNLNNNGSQGKCEHNYYMQNLNYIIYFQFLVFVALAVFVQGSVYEGDHVPIAYSHPYLGQPPYYSRVSYKPIVAPVTKTVVQPAVAHYDFGYALSNPYGDNHQSRVESRRGDIVAGSYSVLDADGTKRIVDYTATPQGGFKAVVRKEPGVLPLAGVSA